jgi:hypothetical protein
VLKLASFLTNPFSFLFAKSSVEDRVAAYVLREHARGRSVADILQDPFVQNRLSPQQQSRMLERSDLIHALGEQDVDAARQALSSLR